MIYRRFGKTGLDISVLSAGCMRSMHSWQHTGQADIPAASQRNLAEIVRTALEMGINHLETARAYGTSEQQLGLVLRDIPRDRYILQTKVQPLASPQKFRKNVLDSLARLQVKRVDLLAIHGINDYRSLWYACRPEGCLAAARKLQQECRIGAVGFSGHGAPEVALAAAAHKQDGGFDYLNLHWYYIYQVNTVVLQAAAEKDLGVFIISPTDKGGRLHDPPEKLRRLCAPLTPMIFNDAYCLLRPEVHTISIGAARPGDFAEHRQALDYLGRSETVGEIAAGWAAAMKEATGFARPDVWWGKFPAWDHTPGLINIPFVLWLYNLVRGWDLLEYSLRRYRLLGRDVKWVPGRNGRQAGKYELAALAEAAGMKDGELVRQLEEAHQLLGEPAAR